MSRCQGKSLSAVTSQAEEAEQYQADLEAPVVLFCKEIPIPSTVPEHMLGTF